MTKHNKKRNIGIIYELFSGYITELVLENNKKKIKKATKILERRFKKGTELYKEFRLFNALVNSEISSKNKAVLIIENAKKDILEIDNKKLNYEKSILIKDINYNLNDKNFYYRTVKNYRAYANIQNLFNEWREKDNNLKTVLIKEEKAINWLLEKKNADKKVLKESNKNSNNLVLNIMTKKINEKYSNMAEDQKQIIRNYALYAVDNKEYFQKFLLEKKVTALKEINLFQQECDNQIILEKISNVKEKINSLSNEPNTDQDIIKYLTISGLIKELKE
jgi:hypothetical protein